MVNKINFVIVLLILIFAVIIVQQIMSKGIISSITTTTPFTQNIKPSSLDSDLTVSQQLTDYDIISNEYVIPPMP